MSILNRIYHVDLTSGRIDVTELSDAELRQYPGGSALGYYLLWKHCPRGADPLGPDNTLIFAVSPLTGLPIAGQSRVTTVAKSPLTGGTGDAQGGGYFPAEMAAAGALAILFTGRAPEPVYLWLKDGEAQLRPAGHLWGMPTGDVEAAIREELVDPKVQMAEIGPAGENQVRLAAIMNMANRAAARTGLGAVMGSKNLKAVAVRGTQPRKAAVPEAFSALARRWKELEAAAMMGIQWGKMGTGGALTKQDYMGGLPTYNFNSGHFAAAEQISGERMNELYLKEQDTCYACAIRCKRVIEIPGHVDPVYGGPEYESLATLGSYCGVDDLVAVCKAAELCNKYGLDTVGTGATIAWAMECFEHGLLTREQTGGIELRFGNAAAAVQMVEMIARREGIGDLLAEGSARAARRLGPAAEALTITVKGAEAPAHMPQVKSSMGVIYAVNPYGADHTSAGHDTSLVAPPGSLGRLRLGQLGIHFSAEPRKMGPEKARFTFHTQCFQAILDTFTVCLFVYGAGPQVFGPAELVELVQAATGWQTSLFELMKVGERRINLARAFNIREGIDGSQDRLPQKFFKPLRGGASDGWHVDPDDFEQAKRLYYQMAGWNAEGVPTRGKLVELDLEWLADEIGATA